LPGLPRLRLPITEVFNLRKAKREFSAFEEGDLRPDQVKLLAKRVGVTERDVIQMNRRLGGDASLNTPIRDDGDSGDWHDWLVDDAPSQERVLVDPEELGIRRKALGEALTVAQQPRAAHLRGAPSHR
jgi:RNA polymerase sigma-32 factor